MTTHASSTDTSMRADHIAGLASMSAGDERWARRQPQLRERELALVWPLDLLESFSLRMASHGMSISRALMMCDRQYAVQQLTHAQGMEDACLHDLAVQLLTHYEARPLGMRALH